jgi:hypothetical protein
MTHSGHRGGCQFALQQTAERLFDHIVGGHLQDLQQGDAERPPWPPVRYRAVRGAAMYSMFVPAAIAVGNLLVLQIRVETVPGDELLVLLVVLSINTFATSPSCPVMMRRIGG